MTVGTVATQTSQDTDFMDVINDVARRIQLIEQQGAIASSLGSDFPTGITIGTGPSAVTLSTSISGLSGLTASAGAYLSIGYMDVSWSIPDDTVSYIVFFYALKDLSGGTYQQSQSVTITGSSFRLEPLLTGRTYGIYAVPFNRLGIPGPALEPFVSGLPDYTDVNIPADSTVPPTITGIATNLGADTLVVAWNGVSSTELDVLDGGYYEVELDETSNAFTSVVADWRGAATVMSFDGLAAVSNAQSNYWVRVRAVSVGGIGGAWADANSGSPIPAGGVSGTDILARTVTAVSIVAGTITSNEIAANTITAGNIAAATITAAQLTAMQLYSGQYIRSTTYVAGVSGWDIDANGNAEFNNVDIIGNINSSTITASTILASTLESASSGARIVTNTSVVGGLAGNGVTPGILFYGMGSAAGDTTHPAAIFGFLASYSGTTYSGIGIQAPGGTTGLTGNITVEPAGVQIEAVGTSAAATVHISVADTGGNYFINMDSGTQSITFVATYVNIDAALGTEGITASGDIDTGFNVNALSGSVSAINMFATAFTVTSDLHLKEKVLSLDGASIHQLRPVSFNWRGNADNRLHYGLIAQEVQKVLPDLVDDHFDGSLSMNYMELIPLLISEVQKLRKEVDTIRST